MKNNITLIILIFIYVLVCIHSAINGGDFDVYLDAAVKLSNGQNIYTPPFIKNIQYFYSPLFALVLIPFSFNSFVPEFIWLLLTGFLLYRIWILIKSYFDISMFSSKEIFIWGGISFFFIIRFFLYNITMIQITIFLLWGILESIRLIKNDKTFLGVVLLAFVINIKLLPLVVLPYLLYRGYFKEFLYVIGFILIFLFLPSIFIGFEFNSFLLREWWAVINPFNNEHMIEAWTNSQSLVGIVPVFITHTKNYLPFKRNFISLSVETTKLITIILRLLLIWLTVYFLGRPFHKKVDKISDIRAISYILLIIPLIFPHQNKYAFIFIFPMVVYISYYCLLMWKYNRKKTFIVYLSLLLIISLVYTPFIGSDVIGRYSYDLIHYFRILGISTLLLILFAIIAKPSVINKLITGINKNE